MLSEISCVMFSKAFTFIDVSLGLSAATAVRFSFAVSVD